MIVKVTSELGKESKRARRHNSSPLVIDRPPDGLSFSRSLKVAWIGIGQPPPIGDAEIQMGFVMGFVCRLIASSGE